MNWKPSELSELRSWILSKEHNTTAFIGKPRNIVQQSETVMMVGSKARGWCQALRFYGEDHKEKAEMAVKEYNAAKVRITA